MTLQERLDAAEARATAAERERDALVSSHTKLRATVILCTAKAPHDMSLNQLGRAFSKMREAAALTANHSAPVVEE